MLQNAPYLTRPLATVIPVNSWFQMQYVRMGLLMYDIIAWKGGLPRRWASFSLAYCLVTQ